MCSKDPIVAISISPSDFEVDTYDGKHPATLAIAHDSLCLFWSSALAGFELPKRTFHTRICMRARVSLYAETLSVAGLSPSRQCCPQPPSHLALGIDTQQQNRGRPGPPGLISPSSLYLLFSFAPCIPSSPAAPAKSLTFCSRCAFSGIFPAVADSISLAESFFFFFLFPPFCLLSLSVHGAGIYLSGIKHRS